MIGRQLSRTEVEQMYIQAAEIAKKHIGFHPAFILVDPVDAVKDWVQGHPNEALALAEDFHGLINRYFGNSSRS